MAACTELELEEKSSDGNLRNAVNENDSTFYNISSNSGCNAAWNASRQNELGSQLRVDSETGDLKELSDDEFLHLLKEASTFNKPNNQESRLLKQLRQAVAESDSCENVSRNETGCVSKVVNRKCSKLSYGNSHSDSLCSSVLQSIPPTLNERIFDRPVQKRSNKNKEPSMYSSAESSYLKCSNTINEIRQSYHKWSSKSPKAASENSFAVESEAQASSFRSDVSLFESSLNHSDLSVGVSDQRNGADNVSTSSRVKPENKSCPPASGECNNSMDEQIAKSPLKGSQEIELVELRTRQNKDMADVKENRNEARKCQVNSKFYVNCNDVDTTVAFPLKLISGAVDERNGSGIICDSVNEQLKQQMPNISCFSWPRTHPFLGALPLETEALHSQNDSDNGNPFSRNARAANITSFVSATLLDYPSSTLMSETHSSKLDYNHRKHKRTRNNTENNTFILSENIAGHRGNLDIDDLVKFIEADKSDKVFTRNNANHLLKNISSQDALKRRLSGKDSKVNQNKNSSFPKKKNLDDSNAESGKSDNLSFENKVLGSESESSDDYACHNSVKEVPNECAESNQCLVSNQCLSSSTLENSSSCQESSDGKAMVEGEIEEFVSTTSVFPKISLSSDTCAISESLPQPAEESGFRIVKKKQRKRYQVKRSDNYRWHSAAARVRQSTSSEHDYYAKEQTQHNNGMMLLSQRNQCGKQDSRRKSTSSVPHSEQSSADNSDLDSVHSLPVRGSAPHPTKMHPHTTPSSSSSTPQASYADIARMPVSSSSKLSSTPINGSALSKPVGSSERSPTQLENVCAADKSTKLSESSENHATKNSPHVKSTRETNTQTEPLTIPESVILPKNEISPTPHVQKSSSVSPSEKCSECFRNCKNSACTKIAFKQDRPAVVMMGNIPLMERSDISFGIDLKEILQISSGENADLKSSAPASVSVLPVTVQSTELHQDSLQQTVGKPHKSSLSDNVSTCDGFEKISTLCKRASSPCNELRLASGQRLQFSEEAVDMQKFNYSQIVDLFAREWKNVQKEFSSEMNKSEERVKYYQDTC